MKASELAEYISKKLVENPKLFALVNAPELLTLISFDQGWEITKKDRKRLRKLKRKIDRYEKARKLSRDEARSLLEKIKNGKNKRSMKYYSDKYKTSIAALVQVVDELPEKIENESLFVHNGVKFPDGSAITKSEYERITGKTHYQRNRVPDSDSDDGSDDEDNNAE